MSSDFLRCGDPERDWDGIGESDQVEFFPWVYSLYPGDRRSDIIHVSHTDWDEAQRIINSAITAQGREIAETNADVCAMLGALYLITYTGVSSNGQIRKPSHKYVRQIFSSLEKCFEAGDIMYPPPVIFTPAVSQFRRALYIKYPDFCRELGSDLVKWYSASMTFIGFNLKLYDSTEEYEFGGAGRVTEGLRDLVSAFWFLSVSDPHICWVLGRYCSR